MHNIIYLLGIGYFGYYLLVIRYTHFYKYKRKTENEVGIKCAPILIIVTSPINQLNMKITRDLSIIILLWYCTLVQYPIIQFLLCSIREIVLQITILCNNII